jgi:hypothetical protein
MDFFKKARDVVRDGAAIGWQAVKEKVGVTAFEVDPEYDAAAGHIDVLRARLTEFLGDISNLLDRLTMVTQCGADLSSGLTSASRGAAAPIVATVADFLSGTNDHFVNELLVTVLRGLLNNLQGRIQMLDGLKDLRSDRYRTRLLCNSLRDQLESISARGKPAEIAKIKGTYEMKMQELQILTQRIKGQSSEMWRNRAAIFQEPLHTLVGCLMQFCEDVGADLAQLQPEGATVKPPNQEEEEETP